MKITKKKNNSFNLKKSKKNKKMLAIIIKVCYNVFSATIMLELSQDRKIAALIASYCVHYNCVLKRVPIVFIGILFLLRDLLIENNVSRGTLFS